METELTLTQHKAIQLLLAGSSIAATARGLGIDRTTIYVWRKSNPYFSNILNRAQSLQKQILQDDIQDLATTAIDTIRGLLTSPETPAAVRLRAAQTVLDAGNRRPASDAPKFNPVAEAAAVESIVGPPAENVQQHSTLFNTSERTLPATFNNVGRNEPCPCASGLKFKRCCGNPVSAQLQAAA